MTHTLTARLDKPLQAIEGFGASGCWWAQSLGSWEAEALEPVLDLLYSSSKGIGLTQYRHTIGGGTGMEIADPWRRSECYEVSPNRYDWTRDAAARRVLRGVCERGINELVLFSNSPPARLTRSGYASGALNGSSNLPPEHAGMFARFLANVLERLRDEGFPVTHVSPVNEPYWDWQPSKGQEGCHYEPDECVHVVRAVLEVLEAEGSEVHLSAIDAHDWGSAHRYADALMRDPYVAERLEHFAVHSYWSDAAAKAAFAAHAAEHYPHLSLWMSEWTEMETGQDTGMDSALCLASTVHDDLTLGLVTSWQYWIAVSKYNFRDGLLYADEASQSVTETKRLWTLGNYSRFIAPGSRRVALSGGDAPLKASAFLDADGKKLTVVCINESDAPVQARFELPNLASVMRRYETSDSHSLGLVEETLPTQALRFPARSISTVVLE